MYLSSLRARRGWREDLLPDHPDRIRISRCFFFSFFFFSSRSRARSRLPSLDSPS